MFNQLARELRLVIQARSGASPAGLLWIAIFAIALLGFVVFLCITAYGWLSLRYDPVIAGLIMSGGFALVALIAASVALVIRRRTRRRALLEQAAQQTAMPTFLLDPKFLSMAADVGRIVGWQRIVPIAVFGLVVAQWVRDHHRGRRET
jgi:amino acid transporter